MDFTEDDLMFIDYEEDFKDKLEAWDEMLNSRKENELEVQVDPNKYQERKEEIANQDNNNTNNLAKMFIAAQDEWGSLPDF
jgi:hypothetical protein